MPPIGGATPESCPASQCTRPGQQFPAEYPPLHRQSSTLFVRQSQSPSHELRFKNIILSLQILDRRLLCPVQPPGEHHDQNMHRQRCPHVRLFAFFPFVGNASSSSSTFWTPRALVHGLGPARDGRQCERAQPGRGRGRRGRKVPTVPSTRFRSTSRRPSSCPPPSGATRSGPRARERMPLALDQGLDPTRLRSVKTCASHFAS